MSPPKHGSARAAKNCDGQMSQHVRTYDDIGCMSTARNLRQGPASLARMPSRSRRPRGRTSVVYRRAGALASLGPIAVGVAVLAAACTNNPVRPAPGAALVEATALDDTHGLLVFRHTEADAQRHFVAKHGTDGAIVWTRALEP